MNLSKIVSIYFLLVKINIVQNSIKIMKIKCPKCNKDAELTTDFSLVKCKKCNLEMSYGEYVRFVAHNEKTYSDILGDYTGSTEGETAGSLDEWD